MRSLEALADRICRHKLGDERKAARIRGVVSVLARMSKVECYNPYIVDWFFTSKRREVIKRLCRDDFQRAVSWVDEQRKKLRQSPPPCCSLEPDLAEDITHSPGCLGHRPPPELVYASMIANVATRLRSEYFDESIAFDLTLDYALALSDCMESVEWWKAFVSHQREAGADGNLAGASGAGRVEEARKTLGMEPLPRDADGFLMVAQQWWTSVLVTIAYLY